MACELGCDPEYVLLVTDRCGGNVLQQLDFAALRWERVQDDTSQAEVVIPEGCCDKLGDIRTWRHELHVIRDGKEQWVGPIIATPNCRSGTSLIARDMSQWLARRVIRERRCFATACGGVATTGPRIAESLIRLGFEPDDPCVLEHLTVIDGGGTQERDYLANSGYVADALRDLARSGVDWTVIGRRIVVTPDGYELGRTAMLTCDSFLGDVCVTEDGLAAATKAIVTGEGVVGESGGVDPYFGLIEVLLDDDSITTAASADAAAASIVAASNPPPLLVEPPQGSYLDPAAPVCMEELVPGVLVPVVLDCTCRDAAQGLRLAKLTVTVDADGEKVSPLLVEPGLSTGGI